MRAIDLLDEDTPPRTRGNYLLRLADALALNGSVEESRERYEEAEAIFVEIDDRERRLSVLNNRTMLEYEAGNVAEALEAAERHATLRARAASSTPPSRTRSPAPGSPRAASRPPSRPRGSRFDLHHERGDVHGATPAELGLTLTEILIAQGRLDEAADELDRCLAVCHERELRGVAVDALRVRSELLAARGAYREAYQAVPRLPPRVGLAPLAAAGGGGTHPPGAVRDGGGPSPGRPVPAPGTHRSR